MSRKGFKGKGERKDNNNNILQHLLLYITVKSCTEILNVRTSVLHTLILVSVIISTCIVHVHVKIDYNIKSIRK